jgi:hypothetical protein
MNQMITPLGGGRARRNPWLSPGPYHPGVVTYFAGRIPDDQWRPLLGYCLRRADSFAVHFPDGPGMLSCGREEFPALAGVRVGPWSGMRNSIEVTGPLTAESRGLFGRIETSVTRYEPERKLWDYRLSRQSDPLLQVGDFSDVLVTADDGELAALRAEGVSTERWNLA